MKKSSITVVPLGPGSPDLMTLQAAELLQSGQRLFLRTAKHPVSEWLDQKGIQWTSLDDQYDRAEDFDALNDSITAILLSAAAHEPILYAVPDPLTDQTVLTLRKKAGDNAIPFRTLPGVSMADTCMAAGLRGSEEGSFMRINAIDFSGSAYDPNVSLLITEIDSRILAGEIKLSLNEYLDDETMVVFFPPSDAPFRKMLLIPLTELDRQKKYDQTVSVYLQGSDYRKRDRFVFQDLQRIMKRLRAQDGCPWDRAQTHLSLRPYMVEEAWEAVDAIDMEDMDHLSDELGDVLLQVVFHASIAESYDEFTMTDVISNICKKMLKRHPRLFGTEPALQDPSDLARMTETWEALKRAETGSRTVGESLNDVSSSLPSLKYAIKINKKLAQLRKAVQSSAEVAQHIRTLSSSLLSGDNSSLDQKSMGKLLIYCMELCRLADVDGEVLLHEEVNRLKEKYQKAEKIILKDKKAPESLTFQQLGVYLNKVEE